MQFLVASLMVMASFSAGAMEIKKVTHKTCIVEPFAVSSEAIKSALQVRGYEFLENEDPSSPLVEYPANTDLIMIRINKKVSEQNKEKRLLTISLEDANKSLSLRKVCDEKTDEALCDQAALKLAHQLPICVKEKK